MIRNWQKYKQINYVFILISLALCLLICAFATSLFSEKTLAVASQAENNNTITEYFYNVGNWDEVYLYTWGDSGSDKIEPAPWPGVPATKIGPKVYSYTFDKSSGLQYYIFNDKGNGNQTADTQILDKSISITPAQYTTSPGEDERTIYFDNTETKWDQVWIMKTKVKDAEEKWVETYTQMERISNSDSDIWKYTYPNDVKFPPTDLPRTCFRDVDITEKTSNIIKNITWSEGKHLLVPGYNVESYMCNINFDTQGHGSAPQTQQVVYKGYIEEPSAPTAEGYTFQGWYKQPQCTEAWDFSIDTPDDHMTLYAKFVANQSAENDNNTTPTSTSSTSDNTNIVGFLGFIILAFACASTACYVCATKRRL